MKGEPKMSTVDEKMMEKEKQAKIEAESLAAAFVANCEEYVETRDDERADNLRHQTRDNLAACIFNDIMAEAERDVRALGPTLDVICEYAADEYKYKTWYGMLELDGICDEFDQAMQGRLLEFPVEPFMEVYRINDRGDYVSYADFEAYWEGKPETDQIGWMLAGNGQLSGKEVAAMSYDDAKAFYESEEFEPEVAYYTQADETGEC